MRFTTVLLVCWLALVTLPANLPAQTGEDEIIEIDTQLVDVPIVVTDAAGKPILSLKRDNFNVYEDGKLQEITSFAATEAPFEVALLLDTSGSTRNDLRLIKRSAQMFIESLRAGDRVSIVAFNTDYEKDRRMNLTAAISVSELLIELTDDRARLAEALENVRTSNGTPFYDGLVQVAEKVYGNPPSDRYRGRRALVALTDGVDSTSLADFEEARELLEKAGIVTYFIHLNTRENFEADLLGDCETGVRFSDAQIKRYYALFGGNSRIEKVYDFCRIGDFTRLDMSKKLYELAGREMLALAKTSGGKVFPAASIGDARNAFRAVAGEIGTNYSLGYYPTNDKRDGTYRKITVELKNLPKGTQIRAREGYTAPEK
jgi:VWFA-related protein